MSDRSNQPYIKRFLGHLKTVLIHKYYVARGCFKCGLYLQGIAHDLSKFSPAEFLTGVRYYSGRRSPNAIERELNDGCSKAWLHHKGRNKHHYEYWVDFSGKVDPPVYGNRMPAKYLAEMVCDRIAACKTYQGENYTDASPWEYYMRTRSHMIINRETDDDLRECLEILKDRGEDACFEHVRELIRRDRDNQQQGGAL